MTAVHPIDASAYRAALAHFASGVTVVTARAADGRDHGMTISAFASLSLEPPLVLACIDLAATLLPQLRAADFFGVSILSSGQEEISARFAEKGIVRTDGIALVRSEQGPALIDGATAHLVCRRVAEHAGGDHAIIVGEVVRADAFGGAPLLYFDRRYAHLT